MKIIYSVVFIIIIIIGIYLYLFIQDRKNKGKENKETKKEKSSFHKYHPSLIRNFLMFFYLISRIFTSYGSSTRLTVHTSPTLWSMMTSASGVVFESLPLNGSASIVPTILNVTS